MPKIVSEKRVQKINSLLGFQWESPVYYKTISEPYSPLNLGDPIKKNCCSSILDLHMTGSPRYCPHYLMFESFCMFHSCFVLNPAQSTCSYHPTNGMQKLWQTKSEFSKMWEEFENRSTKEEDCDDFLTDMMDYIEYMDFTPISDKMSELKREVLKFALLQYAKVAQYRKGGLK